MMGYLLMRFIVVLIITFHFILLLYFCSWGFFVLYFMRKKQNLETDGWFLRVVTIGGSWPGKRILDLHKNKEACSALRSTVYQICICYCNLEFFLLDSCHGSHCGRSLWRSCWWVADMEACVQLRAKLPSFLAIFVGAKAAAKPSNAFTSDPTRGRKKKKKPKISTHWQVYNIALLFIF